MGNDGEYLRRLGEGEIHGEKLRFRWFWVGGLRRGESSRHLAQGEGGSERGGQLGPGPVNLIRKCGATQHGAAEATAAPPSVAPR
jgi:hypothetical protein